MDYAIIETGGKQYKVKHGGTISVDHLGVNEGETVKLDKVLLVVENGQAQIGTPYLANVSFTATVVRSYKGDKVRVAKFLAKSRYRKVRGFRQMITELQIEGEKPELKKAAASVKEENTVKKVTRKKTAAKK